jgi:hypothetical protein
MPNGLVFVDLLTSHHAGESTTPQRLQVCNAGYILVEALSSVCHVDEFDFAILDAEELNQGECSVT